MNYPEPKPQLFARIVEDAKIDELRAAWRAYGTDGSVHVWNRVNDAIRAVIGPDPIDLEAIEITCAIDRAGLQALVRAVKAARAATSKSRTEDDLTELRNALLAFKVKP